MADRPEDIHLVRFTLDGRPISARPDENLLEIAHRAGVEIPRLCYMQGLPADGNCRACVVEIEGERQDEPAVVIDVLTDEVDPTRRAGPPGRRATEPSREGLLERSDARGFRRRAGARPRPWACRRRRS